MTLTLNSDRYNVQFKARFFRSKIGLKYVHCKVFCAKSGHSVGKFESRYLILCALHLARPLSECVIGMGKIGSYHYLCFANTYKIVKLCEGSAQNDGPDSFVCSLVIMSVCTSHSL